MTWRKAGGGGSDQVSDKGGGHSGVTRSGLALGGPHCLGSWANGGHVESGEKTSGCKVISWEKTSSCFWTAASLFAGGYLTLKAEIAQRQGPPGT